MQSQFVIVKKFLLKYNQFMAGKIPERVKEILVETRRELEKIYPNRLKDIILFGSYARGDFEDTSDIDVLLLLDRLTDASAERDRFLPVISRICLKHDAVISVIPMDALEYTRRRTPLILNARREGLRL